MRGLLSICMLTLFSLTSNLPAAAYDDPPEGAVLCGATVKVSSSKHCNGGPAIVIGGCDKGTRPNPSGRNRQTICQKGKKAN